jgi:5,10-methylenetetrahydromethanopterin reductase
MALAAANTRSMLITSGITPYRTRHVTLLATTFRTLDRLAPGRIRVALGTGAEPVAIHCGLNAAKPVAAMREVVTALRGLLSGQQVTLKGEYVHVDGLQLEPDEGEAPGSARPIPIYIGAKKEKMLQLAGELTDGVFLDFFVPPSQTASVLEQLQIGLARRGRTLDGFERLQLVACSVDDEDPNSAIDACRLFLTQLIHMAPPVALICGVEPDVVEAVKKETGWPNPTWDFTRAMQHVPRALVQKLAACGRSSDAIARLEEYQAAGCTFPILVPYGNAERTLERLASRLNLARRASR